MSEKFSPGEVLPDFIDEEIIRTDIPSDEILRPTDGSVIVSRSGVRMQVRKIDGEQRIEV